MASINTAANAAATSTTRITIHGGRSSPFSKYSMTCSTGNCHSSSSKRMFSVSRFGLGNSKWNRLSPSAYQELITASLQHGVSWMEAGQDGGSLALATAIEHAYSTHPELSTQPLILTARVGYKSIRASADHTFLPADVLVEGTPERSVDVGQKRSKEEKTKNQGIVQSKFDDGTDSHSSNSKLMVVHNISRDAIRQAIATCPLVKLRSKFENIHLIYMVQNPEVQLPNDLQEQSLQTRQEFLREALSSSMVGLETSVKEGWISSFGIVSNGLGLPTQHPLHLGAEAVLAHVTSHPQWFSTVELPVNLLERRGLDVARQLKAGHPSLTIACMRPLSCYPDLGTGTGHPFGLIDFTFPSFDDATKKLSTHELKGPPAVYQIALQTAMAHFDAQQLLEIKQERKLTMEERETLDGCKLMQSMLHDLDHGLETIRSFAAHEEDLYQRIIPLIYDTFEDFDETTGDVLQAYFAAYGVAVRYAIAKRTRELLKHGGDDGKGVKYEDIPNQMKLQEYALRHLLAEPALDRIVVGSYSKEDLFENLQLFQQIQSESGSPLDVIQQLYAKELEEQEEKEKQEQEQEQEQEEEQQIKNDKTSSPETKKSD